MSYFVKQCKMSVLCLLTRETVSKVPLHIFYSCPYKYTDFLDYGLDPLSVSKRRLYVFAYKRKLTIFNSSNANMDMSKEHSGKFRTIFGCILQVTYWYKRNQLLQNVL
ncbi:DEHA2A03410p [Debaryomyces hansenii CBS767]|uniref:DEHA2A03410p n=1 Tax=Debaryomyces hansenii (strain ATCC 36239 / CBS 767 / BCRC 21394 / JCM 1990 / NBRC 0083 / IGC 2968) TaxID=284592 RepID=B5RSQ1_DEBHA|nr:DEHA2A03410p [Debaryomyces hansenii CBS767]CAR65357.1 DEHA2A03410p [Debaryomyces hansenii CBS767]|eukprot:XP_002769964.1 DEHA2A03410p [Debaryomyces hansenii CBS767]